MDEKEKVSGDYGGGRVDVERAYIVGVGAIGGRGGGANSGRGGGASSVRWEEEEATTEEDDLE